jgi:hypothetical protein
MQVIPVLDLLDGHVVRAVRGERTAYQPIHSPLAATSEPLHIARALLAASGARTLYIADLGAILQQGAHVETLAVRAYRRNDPAQQPRRHSPVCSARSRDARAGVRQRVVARHRRTTRRRSRRAFSNPFARPPRRSTDHGYVFAHPSRAHLGMVASQGDRDDARSGRQLRRSRPRHVRTYPCPCSHAYRRDRRGRHSPSRGHGSGGPHRRFGMACGVCAARSPYRPAIRRINIGVLYNFHANRRRSRGCKQTAS